MATCLYNIVKTHYAVSVMCTKVLARAASTVKCLLLQIWSAETGREVSSQVVGERLYFTAETPALGVSAWRVAVSKDCARAEEETQSRGELVLCALDGVDFFRINKEFIHECTASVLICLQLICNALC